MCALSHSARPRGKLGRAEIVWLLDERRTAVFEFVHCVAGASDVAVLIELDMAGDAVVVGSADSRAECLAAIRRLEGIGEKVNHIVRGRRIHGHLRTACLSRDLAVEFRRDIALDLRKHDVESQALYISL